MIIANEPQPFRLDQTVVLERLDRRAPAPPAKPMTFRSVYRLFFLEGAEPLSGWTDLNKWLRSKNWVIKPKET